MAREEIVIPSRGGRLAAWLMWPDGDGPHPAVVLAHGFGAVKEAGLAPYAERFVAAGLVAVVFDYRHFGGSTGEPRQLLSVRRQLEDWRAAVSFTRGLPGVDPDRVVLWGTSFAGGHVVVTAARDPRIAAVVVQVPFSDGLRTALVLPTRSALKVTGAGIVDLLRRGVGAAPLRIPLVGPPGSLAAMATPQAVDGYPRLTQGLEVNDGVPARIGLRIPTYRPIRYVHDVRCPLLVQAGDHDDLTTAAAAEAMARRAPRGRFSSFPTGHFGLYFAPWFEKVVDEQVGFLLEHAG